MKKPKAQSKLTKNRGGGKSTARRTPVAHAKHILSITPKFVHGVVVGAFVGLLVVSLLRQVSPTSALTINVSRDCTANAVIHCGAITTDELKARYSQAGVAAIYAYYGITADDIKNIGSTAVAGVAYKDGTIKINSTGEIVATGSVSTGRRPISGSSRVSSGGVTFYETASQKAFRSNALPVYVVMQDNQFKFAIIPNCANSMRATAVARPRPQPTPPPTNSVAPLPRPPLAFAPQRKVASSEVEALPVTGPVEIGIIGVLAVIGGYAFHVTHRNVRSRGQHKHTIIRRH